MAISEQKYEELLKTIFHDVLSQKKFDLLDQVCTKNAVFNDGKETVVGIEAIKKLINDRNAAVPDFVYTIDDTIIKGNKAVVRWHAKGHAQRDMGGFQAGQSANYWGTSWFQVENDLITKTWANSSVVDVIPEN